MAIKEELGHPLYEKVILEREREREKKNRLLTSRHNNGRPLYVRVVIFG